MKKRTHWWLVVGRVTGVCYAIEITRREARERARELCRTRCRLNTQVIKVVRAK